jgi:hypothetical protein
VIELHTEALVRVELAGAADQPLRELGIDPPVAHLVGIGKRRSAHRFAKAHMVELAGLRRQTRLDVAQTLAIGELREGHDAELLGAAQDGRSMIAAVAPHDAFEACPGQKLHDLREQCLASVHG